MATARETAPGTDRRRQQNATNAEMNSIDASTGQMQGLYWQVLMPDRLATSKGHAPSVCDGWKCTARVSLTTS
jgi:hypothetical protein